MDKVDWGKLIPWAAAIVFAAGGAIFSHQNAVSQLNDLKNDLREHERVGAHPSASTRLTVLEARVRALELDREVMARDISEMRDVQYEILRQLTAVCSATGARCKE